MKKIFFIFALAASFSLNAQFVTSPAKNVAENQFDGVIYSLPRNVLRVEFCLEETTQKMGPYAEFAESLLGITDVIKEDKTEIKIKNVDIQVITESDPENVYFISFDDKGKDQLPGVILDENGVIVAFGHETVPAEMLRAGEFREIETDDSSSHEPISFVDIVEGNDSDDQEAAPKRPTKEDRAKFAVEQIRKLRVAYFDIISGFQEVAFGDATKYMSESIKSTENEYLSLFKGKTVKRTCSKVVYVVPESNQLNSSVTIARFSGSKGLLDAGSKSGEAVKIQFESCATLKNVKAVADDVKTSAQANKLFYRIPESADVKVSCDNKTLAEGRFKISQFGKVQLIQPKGRRIVFNPGTGQVISIVH
ncbi:MAG: DUF4831 family protein [bacterium]|nr:DUF4831 family protein [Candidatus Limimorpha caballi]